MIQGADLTFGYKDIPPTQAAYGARFIVTQDGHVDLPWDRSCVVADGEPRVRLLAHLDDHLPMPKLRKLISGRLTDGVIDTRSDAVHTIYDDDVVRVVGSAQSSAGYFYLTAYLKEPPPEQDAWCNYWNDYGRSEVVNDAILLMADNYGIPVNALAFLPVPDSTIDRVAHEGMSYFYGFSGEYDHDGAVAAVADYLATLRPVFWCHRFPTRRTRRASAPATETFEVTVIPSGAWETWRVTVPAGYSPEQVESEFWDLDPKIHDSGHSDSVITTVTKL